MFSPCLGKDALGQAFFDHSLEPVAVVPEVVLGVHGPVVEDGVLPALDDLVPQHHLVDRVARRRVLGAQVQEQLLDVPVEQRGQVGLQVERQETEVVLLAAKGSRK